MVETDKGFAYEIKDVYKLRNKTRIGESIRFKSDRNVRGDNEGKKKIVRGAVTAKFPYVFLLDTGETYSWVEYFLGK